MGDAVDKVTRARRWGLRVLVFVGGVISGLVLVPVVAGGVLLVTFLARQAPPQKPFSALVTPGVTISEAGGRQATWRARDEMTRQICRGTCDDLRFERGTPRNVEVLGEDRRRLVEGSPPWMARARAYVGGPAPVEAQLDQLKARSQ